MRAYLEADGVPSDRIVEDPFGLDTYDSCVRARDVYGLDAIVLVSQSYHLPRAVGTARRLGLDAYGLGDRSVRGRHEPWVSGTIRDQLACVKAVWDLVSRRRPVEFGPSTAVTDALSAAHR
jgi:vancomycin permeability regulator SanA